MNIKKIEENLKTKYFGKTIHQLESVDSTNSWATRDGKETGEVFIAERQTAGRGRLNRHWESPAGKNILLSFIDRPSANSSKTFHLTLVAGVAFFNGIKKLLHPEGLSLKWPNDIILSGKKMGGILAEHSNNKVVIGVGINVNSTRNDFSPEPAMTATSLFIETGRKCPREEIVAACLAEYENWRKEYDYRGMAGIIAEWNNHNNLLGKKVRVTSLSTSYAGLACELDEDGLLIVDSNGKKQKVISGDVILESNI